jgi:glycosyltransferase involved in cell wall biosynthesis
VRNTPVNIVLFTSSYAPRVGGLETAVSRLAREFGRAGHRVTVVTNRYPRHLSSFECIDGVAVHRILFPAPLAPRSAWGRTNMAAFVLLLPLAPWALLRLWLLLRRLRPHVVNIHYLSSPAFYVAILSFLRVLQARIVISCHGSDLTTVPYPTGSLRGSRWIIARAHAVTVCSAALARDVALMAPRLPGGAVRVVYNGADVDEFASAVPFTHPRPYILSVGRLTEQKGMHVLVEALGLLRERGMDCDLIIAGSGPGAQRLRARAAALGLADHVHLEGSTGRARLGALYRGCAVFALAPVQEGFGIVSLEAMSCACAVVATRSGGIPEVVRDGETGLLARPGDPLDLADKLAALLADSARAAEMGRRGRARVAGQFTWPVVAARYLDAYRPTTPRALACAAPAACPVVPPADGVHQAVAARPAHGPVLRFCRLSPRSVPHPRHACPAASWPSATRARRARSGGTWRVACRLKVAARPAHRHVAELTARSAHGQG